MGLEAMASFFDSDQRLNPIVLESGQPVKPIGESYGPWVCYGPFPCLEYRSSKPMQSQGDHKTDIKHEGSVLYS